MDIHFPPRRILVPTDFSPPARSALSAAKELGRLFHADLELVSVRQPSYVTGIGPIGDVLPVSGTGPSLVELRGKLLLEGGDYPASRLRVRACAGMPVDTLTQLASTDHADLIVMGTHGYEGLDRLLHGSTAEAMVRRSRIPVLTVRQRRAPFKVRRVLCAVNISLAAGRTFAYAKKLARAAGATLTVLHVVEEGWEEDARRELKAYLHLTPHEDLLILRGEPRAVIERQARKGGYDLIVLAEHLHPWSSDRLLGSTAERVVRHVAAPVLSIPAPLPVRPAVRWLALSRK
jgi:nucleotide-binding universal stress UspA family protein